MEEKKPGATIIPVIIATDKTQLTLFRGKSAYPVYLTIGNIPKEIRRKPSRRGYVLLGYLPSERLDHIKSKETRRRASANLFHACMRRILQPIRGIGISGLEMASGDGVVRRCHPILAAFVGDYPEQCLAACCKNFECPKCHVPREDLGKLAVYENRNLEDILKALSTIDRGPAAYIEACKAAGIKPVRHPFWEGLPFSNIFISITPDNLHQLYQGMVKHMISWIKSAFGVAEVDARFRRLPPNHNIRLFSKGISHMSRITGQEHKDICRVLLGVIVDLPLKGRRSPAHLIRAVRALLDFVYLAQYPSHTSTTLEYMNDVLARFHENKAIFLEIGARQDFKLPKLHALTHYVRSIKLFGTTDNYDTAYPERLHIDLTKNAYRSTNRKDEYPQMTSWLERREKIQRHTLFVQWRHAGHPVSSAHHPIIPRHLHIKIARFPNEKAVPIDRIPSQFGAIEFRQALAEFILTTSHPSLSTHQIRALVPRFRLTFRNVPVFYKIKFWNPDAQGRDDVPETLDCVHIRPRHLDSRGRTVPDRFDTVLIDEKDGKESRVKGSSTSYRSPCFSES